MPQISRECPHCKSEKMGFSPRAVVGTTPGSSEALMFMQCEGCYQGIVLVLNNTAAGVSHWVNGQSNSYGQITNVYPTTSALVSPADVPGPVQAAFLSGLDNLDRKGGANAAAIMFRRSIEVAIKIISPNASKNDNLKKRIADLPDSVATPAMKDWANHIRLDANDAVHEVEEYSDEDANQLHTFAEMFLTYAFTLPAMLKRASTPAATG